MALYKIRRHPSRVENSLPPWFHFSKKHKGIGYSKCPPGHGDSAALCETKAVVFPWKEAGLKAFRLFLRKPFGFGAES
jgi:hypothetical protein